LPLVKLLTDGQPLWDAGLLIMEVNKIYQEPCIETLGKMPNDSIDCVITSPPYWQLRDYGYEGQWGLEPTFQEYLEHLWSMMDLIYLKLKPEGTCWVNLGDTYGTKSGNMTGGNMFENKIKYTGGIENYTKPNDLHKCVLLIPHRFAISCIDRGWIVRNDVIWAKRNGMPESVTDRFSKKHEYFFFMVKSEKYYFDLDAVKDKFQNSSIERMNYPRYSDESKGMSGEYSVNNPNYNKESNGKNPGSVSDFWDIPTKPSSEKHYASYNDSLLVKPVLAGCPKSGVIYDPFMGTGSTAEVAIRSGRKFIGSEMSIEYCKIANKRIEPFLSQQTLF